MSFFARLQCNCKIAASESFCSEATKILCNSLFCNKTFECFKTFESSNTKTFENTVVTFERFLAEFCATKLVQIDFVAGLCNLSCNFLGFPLRTLGFPFCELHCKRLKILQSVALA